MNATTSWTKGYLTQCVIGALLVSVFGSPVRYELGSGCPNTMTRRIADERFRYKK
jgi:hypothetical protein